MGTQDTSGGGRRCDVSGTRVGLSAKIANRRRQRAYMILLALSLFHIMILIIIDPKVRR